MSREDGDLQRENQAMHEDNFLTQWLAAGGCARRKCGNGEVQEEKLNKKRDREKKKKGWKREVAGERERFEIKRRCLDRMCSEVFDDFNLISDVECVGVPFGFSVCA